MNLNAQPVESSTAVGLSAAGFGPNDSNLVDILFDLDDLDGSILESGLVGEFEVQHDARRKLAAQGLTMVSIAIGAVTDEEFERYLAGFEAPADDDEVAFLFGFCEHVRQEILGVFDAGDEFGFRTQLRRRMERARALCRSA